MHCKSLWSRGWASTIIGLTLLFLTGCAEGPLWRAGKYSPWARNHWAAEEQIADTLFARKRKMTELASSAISQSTSEQEAVAKELSEIAHRDSVLLLRIHAVNLLGQLKSPTAIQTLREVSRDHNYDMRIAAIKAWQGIPGDIAIPQLQEIIGSDTNVDVRLAATKALGEFSGQQAVTAISLALEDGDPALQLRAAESLQKVTGEKFGRDIVAWQNFIATRQSSGTAANDVGDEFQPLIR